MLFVFLLLGRDYLHYLAHATHWERSAGVYQYFVVGHPSLCFG